MFRIAVLVAVIAAVPFGVTQATGQGNLPDENDCQPRPLTEGRAILKEAWDREGWRQRNPVKKSQVQELRELRGCLDGTGKKKLSNYAQKLKGDFKFHRAYRRVAPYAGFSGEGYLLRWLAIPRYVVSCETNGYSGEGRWHARNGSGAAGPYQLMPMWGAPYPANTPREQLENHQAASRLSLSNWACA